MLLSKNVTWLCCGVVVYASPKLLLSSCEVFQPEVCYNCKILSTLKKRLNWNQFQYCVNKQKRREVNQNLVVAYSFSTMICMGLTNWCLENWALTISIVSTSDLVAPVGQLSLTDGAIEVFDFNDVEDFASKKSKHWPCFACRAASAAMCSSGTWSVIFKTLLQSAAFITFENSH